MKKKAKLKAKLREMPLQELREIARKLKIRNPERLAEVNLRTLILEHDPNTVARMLDAAPKKLHEEIGQPQGRSRRWKFFGIIATAIFTIAVTWYFSHHFWKEPAPPPEDALKEETLDNLRIFSKKLVVADQAYQWMVQKEQMGSKAPGWAPSPYKDLGQRLNRDLPRFKTEHRSLLQRGKWAEKEPFKTYDRIYTRLQSVEEAERETTNSFQSILETYEDVGIIPIGKIKAFTIFFKSMLRNDYLFNFIMTQNDLKQVGVKEVPQIPKDLYFVKELEEEKAVKGKKKNNWR